MNTKMIISMFWKLPEGIQNQIIIRGTLDLLREFRSDKEVQKFIENILYYERDN